MAARRATDRLHAREHLVEAIREGAVLRVRPNAMTVAVIIAGLLPVMWGSGAGSEVMRRIAAPMIGGMVTAHAAVDAGGARSLPADGEAWPGEPGPALNPYGARRALFGSIGPMLTPADAEKLISERLICLPIESLPLAQCAGAVLRENVYAERDQPPFDRVAMDGIALVAARGAARPPQLRDAGHAGRRRSGADAGIRRRTASRS